MGTTSFGIPNYWTGVIKKFFLGIDVKEKLACDGVYKYEEKDNNWFRFAKMPQPRNHHAAVYCKGALYLLGTVCRKNQGENIIIKTL